MSTARASLSVRSFALGSLPLTTVCALVLAGAAAGLLLGRVVGDRGLPAARRRRSATARCASRSPRAGPAAAPRRSQASSARLAYGTLTAA